jgi:hypothetical protein
MLLLIITIFTLSGCRLFKYYLAWETPEEYRAASGVKAEGYVVHDVYYSADPLALGWQSGVMVIMQNALGLEPTGEVTWHISDESIGVLQSYGVTELPPSRRFFRAMPTNSWTAQELIVSAEFEGEIATTKVIVFPSRKIKDGLGLDFDEDGINDVESVLNDSRLRFPFGCYIVDNCFHPQDLGDMNPEEYEAPEVTETLIGTSGSCRRAVFNTSSGRKYGCLFGCASENGASSGVIIWRPL